MSDVTVCSAGGCQGCLASASDRCGWCARATICTTDASACGSDWSRSCDSSADTLPSSAIGLIVSFGLLALVLVVVFVRRYRQRKQQKEAEAAAAAAAAVRAAQAAAAPNGVSVTVPVAAAAMGPAPAGSRPARYRADAPAGASAPGSGGSGVRTLRPAQHRTAKSADMRGGAAAAVGRFPVRAPHPLQPIGGSRGGGSQQHQRQSSLTVGAASVSGVALAVSPRGVISTARVAAARPAGADTGVVCSGCHLMNERDTRFCVRCGAALPRGLAAAATPPDAVRVLAPSSSAPGGPAFAFPSARASARVAPEGAVADIPFTARSEA